jgi:hypothetical protein
VADDIYSLMVRDWYCQHLAFSNNDALACGIGGFATQRNKQNNPAGVQDAGVVPRANTCCATAEACESRGHGE